MASSAMTAPASAVVDMQMQPRTGGVLALVERVAAIPGFDPASLEKLVGMYERSVAREAEMAFNAALNAAQRQMRPIAADATNPQTRSRYATYAALDNKLRPIYTEHGFGLSFNTAESPLPDHVRVLCSVTHAQGHKEPYQVDMPSDGKGAKGGDVMTKTHAAGAAMSYGMRYLLKMIFNVAVGEDDRDGNEAQTIVDPQGFEAWVSVLNAAADKGLQALQAEWLKAHVDFRKHMAKHYASGHEARKVRAANAGKS